MSKSSNAFIVLQKLQSRQNLTIAVIKPHTKKDVEWFHCGTKGHIQKDSYKWKSKQKEKKLD